MVIEWSLLLDLWGTFPLHWETLVTWAVLVVREPTLPVPVLKHTGHTHPCMHM